MLYSKKNTCPSLDENIKKRQQMDAPAVGMNDVQKLQAVTKTQSKNLSQDEIKSLSLYNSSDNARKLAERFLTPTDNRLCDEKIQLMTALEQQKTAISDQESDPEVVSAGDYLPSSDVEQ